MSDLDDLIADEDEYERSISPPVEATDTELDELMGYSDSDKEAQSEDGERLEVDSGRSRVGTVEKFFNRIGVAAIKLTSDLKVGDSIKIGNTDNTVSLTVSSMQINKKNVKSASSGSSVGIKVEEPVSEGDAVYAIS